MVSGIAVASLVAAMFRPVAPSAPHPIHTTITEIRIARGTARITIRVFADDFGRAVHGLPADADAPSRVDEAQAFAYVRSRLTLEAGRRGLALRWCGQRRLEDAYLLCVTAEGVTGLRAVRVANRMHTELYADQVNLVHATAGRERAGVLFLRGDGLKPLARPRR